MKALYPYSWHCVPFSDLCWLCSIALFGARGTRSLLPCENAESDLADMLSVLTNPSDCFGVAAWDADPCAAHKLKANDRDHTLVGEEPGLSPAALRAGHLRAKSNDFPCLWMKMEVCGCITCTCACTYAGVYMACIQGIHEALSILMFACI